MFTRDSLTGAVVLAVTDGLDGICLVRPPICVLSEWRDADSGIAEVWSGYPLQFSGERSVPRALWATSGIAGAMSSSERPAATLRRPKSCGQVRCVGVAHDLRAGKQDLAVYVLPV